MKKAAKIIRAVVIVILVLIISIIALVHFFGNSALKAGIETAAAKTLKVGVSVGDVDFSVLGGRVALQNLVIDNPPDYKHEHLLELGNARVAVAINSLLKDTVNIKEITLDGVTVTLEQRGVTSNNIQDIINSLPKADEKPQAAAEKPSKNLLIDTLEITNVTVNAKLLPIPGKADTVTFKLSPIRMENLGSDSKLDVAELSSKILLAIAGGIAEQGAGVLPDELTGTIKGALGNVTELGKTVTGEGVKILEEGTGAGKEIIEGFKGILQPKK